MNTLPTRQHILKANGSQFDHQCSAYGKGWAPCGTEGTPPGRMRGGTPRWDVGMVWQKVKKVHQTALVTPGVVA